jgi:hypothetical protein
MISGAPAGVTQRDYAPAMAPETANATIADGHGQRRAGLLITAFGLALLIVYVVLWLRLPPSFRAGNDFAPTYAAGQLVLHGSGSAIYDQARILAAERAAVPAGYQVNLPFISPPASALFAAPLAAFSLSSAEVAYSFVQLLATIAAAALIALRVRWPMTIPVTLRVGIVAAAVGAPTVGALLLSGESDGLFTLAVAVSYLWFARGRMLSAGVALGLAAGLGKPHLMIGVLAFLAFRRDLRLVVGCILTATIVNLAAIAVVGSNSALGFVSAVAGSGMDHAPSGLLGLAGLLASWFGNGVPVRVLGLAASVAVIGLCARLGVISSRRPKHTPELFAAIVALSLLASPHLLTPDMVVLVPVLVWLCAVVLGGAAPRMSTPVALLAVAWVWVGVAIVADAANASVGFPGRLTPWGLMLFASAGWLTATRSAGAPRRLSVPMRQGRSPAPT